MRVVNILISDKKIFIEEIIKELIVNNISYVQIDNELHFSDKIYRFYDQEDLLKNKELFLMNEIKLDTDISLDTTDLLDYEKNIFTKIEHNYKNQSKKMIKNQNKLVKRRINPNKKGI